jgi:hypothetical protein
MNRLPLLIAVGCAAGFCGGTIGAVIGHTWGLIDEFGGLSALKSSEETRAALIKAATEMNQEETKILIQQGQFGYTLGGAIGGLVVIFREDKFVPKLTLRNVAKNNLRGCLAAIIPGVIASRVVQSYYDKK